MQKTDELEHDIDCRLARAQPDAYHRMLAARAQMVDSASVAELRLAGKVETVKVSKAPGDAEIEALLGSLLIESYREAMTSFALAKQATVAGGLVEMRMAHLSQGARLAQAAASVAEALMRTRSKGKVEQKITVVYEREGAGAVQ